jgi:predicted PurR-regulated permease PerM
MRKFSFFGSLMTAVLFAVIAFFVLYFFVPSISDEFFGFSYRSSRDTERLKDAVTDILEDARVPKVAIDEYVDKLDNPEFRRSLTAAAEKGTDSVIEFLSKAGEGIDFGSFDSSELGKKLSDGFSRLGSFTSKQWDSIQRIFSGALDSL